MSGPTKPETTTARELHLRMRERTGARLNDGTVSIDHAAYVQLEHMANTHAALVKALRGAVVALEWYVPREVSADPLSEASRVKVNALRALALAGEV